MIFTSFSPNPLFNHFSSDNQANQLKRRVNNSALRYLVLLFTNLLFVSFFEVSAQDKMFNITVETGTKINQTSSSDTGEHLSLIYDFEGLNFDFSVKGMVGTNDSLYIICNTPNYQGLFFRIDENGQGYKVIWEFDNVNRFPSSLVANDTIIYGTTRFSTNGGGTLFKYCLKDYTFEFIKDFEPIDVQEAQIRHITDSVLWLTSQWSAVDEGSIFSLKKDGTELKKIYNDTNLENGQNPVDFIFHNDSIYIAFYNGGGTPYPDGSGSFISSGCFARIKSDGTGYEIIVRGGDEVGTQAQSLVINENKLIGLFAYTGSHYDKGGQFFKCNLDGSAYDSLGALSGRALTRMLSTDSLIYGISLSQIFGVNPFNGEIRIFDELFSNPDWGWDVVSNPTLLNGKVFVATQQGGPNQGGTILRWTNEAPEVNEDNIKSNQLYDEIILNNLFTDPEGDPLSYSYDYNSDEILVEEINGNLLLTLLKDSEASIDITANDGWKGYRTITFNLSPTTSIDNPYEGNNVFKFYPNPAKSILKFNQEGIDLVEIYSLNGTLLKSFKNPSGEINISSLEKGVYILKIKSRGELYTQKIVKY